MNRHSGALQIGLLLLLLFIDWNLTTSNWDTFCHCGFDRERIVTSLRPPWNHHAQIPHPRRCDHITPVLRQLHCLPVRQRVVSKITRLVHQQLPRTSLTTAAFCRTLVVDHCGPLPITYRSCSCREHIIHWVTGVSQQPVLDCGTIHHLD